MAINFDHETNSLTTTTGALTTDGNVSVNATAPTAVDHLTRKDYVDDNFVADAGGTMSGSLNIFTPGNTAGINLKPGITGNSAQIQMQDISGVLRGILYTLNSTGQVSLQRYSDVGVTQTVFTLTTTGNVTVNGTAPTVASHLTRKDYVDNNFVADAGGTMSGNLTIDKATPVLNLEGTGFPAAQLLDGSSVVRGGLVLTSSTGAVDVYRNNSSAGRLTTVSLETDGNVSVNGAAPTADDNLTRKDYVDTVAASRNAIINGNFDVWQRGTSFAAFAGGFTTDRFGYHKSGAMVHTLARSTDVPTYAQSGVKSNYSLHADVTTADASIAAGEYAFIQYKVEGYDYAQLAGGDVTLSFWVKGAKTGVHCVSFRNSNTSRSYVTEYSITTANTWEKKTITVPMTETGGTWDYINGIGISIEFILACGSTFQTTKDAWQSANALATSSQVNELDNVANNFRIAQVQFEKGDVATPFEFRHIGDELALCQRYYQNLYHNSMFLDGYNTTGAQVMAHIIFPVEMRDTPTGSATFAGTSNINSQTITGLGANSCYARALITATGRGYMNITDLKLDAEM